MQKPQYKYERYEPRTNIQKFKIAILVLVGILVLVFILLLVPITWYNPLPVFNKLQNGIDQYSTEYKDTKMPDEDTQELYDTLKGMK